MSRTSNDESHWTSPGTAASGSATGEPVFIIGMPRTGSKIYRNLLNAHTEINISPEILFLAPRWRRSDFMRVTNRAVGASRDDASMARIADLMFEGAYFDCYFRSIGGDKDHLTSLLRASDRSPKGLFEALLKFDARRKGKWRLGAKFPVHIVCAEVLFQWYPSAKFIHLNRNPLAIYSSQKRKYLRKTRGSVNRAVTIAKVLVATIVSYRYSYKVFLRHRKRNNYLFCQYEDLVSDPEVQVRRICNFLDIPFNAAMLDAKWKGSSHGHEKGVGIHQKSRDAWKADVRWIERVMFRLATPHQW